MAGRPCPRACRGAAVDLTWSIYPDAAGLPAGHPATNPGAAVWSYTAAPNAAGVSTAGGFLSLNLAAAGQNLVLPPGTYWLVVNTRGTFANRWAQFGSATGNGSFMSITIDSMIDSRHRWAACQPPNRRPQVAARLIPQWNHLTGSRLMSRWTRLAEVRCMARCYIRRPLGRGIPLA